MKVSKWCHCPKLSKTTCDSAKVATTEAPRNAQKCQEYPRYSKTHLDLKSPLLLQSFPRRGIWRPCQLHLNQISTALCEVRKWLENDEWPKRLMTTIVLNYSLLVDEWPKVSESNWKKNITHWFLIHASQTWHAKCGNFGRTWGYMTHVDSTIVQVTSTVSSQLGGILQSFITAGFGWEEEFTRLEETEVRILRVKQSKSESFTAKTERYHLDISKKSIHDKNLPLTNNLSYLNLSQTWKMVGLYIVSQEGDSWSLFLQRDH